MYFDVKGPYALERFGTNHKTITQETRKELLARLGETTEDSELLEARGCYVFAIKAGKGFTPYYIGQASAQPLVKESLSDNKIVKYADVCSKTKGTPVLFFLPLKTVQGRYRKTSTKGFPSIIFLERWLISQALSKNSDLINTKETSFLRKIHVTGVFNPQKGEATEASRALTRALW